MEQRNGILEQLRSDDKLMAAHRITDAELNFLAKVDMFGSLTSVTDILFILKNIRSTAPSPS